MSNVNLKDFKIEIEDGADNLFEVSFTRRTAWTKDGDYGFDADGRRGMAVVLIDEDTASDLCVKVGEKYVAIQEVNDETRMRIEEAVARWLQDNEAELE